MKKKPNAPRKLRWGAPFLSAYRDSMNIRASCTAASITRSAYYKHLHTSGRFREAVEDAKADALDRVEAVALSRGLNGASDRLLEFWLKSHRPETFGDASERRCSGTNSAWTPLLSSRGPSRSPGVSRGDKTRGGFLANELLDAYHRQRVCTRSRFVAVDLEGGALGGIRRL